MEGIFFKSDTIGPIRVWTTSDGKIDFCALGKEFGLQPNSIHLGADRFPDSNGESKASWMQIKNVLGVVGTREDPVVVSGHPIHEVPIDYVRLPTAGQSLQLFVKHARQNYLELEHSGKKFLEVQGDPLQNVSGEYLIWVRECYVDLKKILVEGSKEPGQRFIVMGTAGIGKSLFTVFWVCYLATQKKRIVWKLVDGLLYLLDFSQDAATAHGPVDMLNPIMLEVLNDVDSWLIIDGGQKTPLLFKCNILLACSTRKEDHHEFGKDGGVKTLYLPVWERYEIKFFCKAFVEHKPKFSSMDVPDKDKALSNYNELGGVARYVLCAGKMEEGMRKLSQALRSVTVFNFLNIYGGGTEWSDILSHLYVEDEEYTSYEYRCACSKARDEFEKQFKKLPKEYVVDLLERAG